VEAGGRQRRFQNAGTWLAEAADACLTFRARQGASAPLSWHQGRFREGLVTGKTVEVHGLSGQLRRAVRATIPVRWFISLGADCGDPQDGKAGQGLGFLAGAALGAVGGRGVARSNETLRRSIN
jgi:hypothetical protein